MAAAVAAGSAAAVGRELWGLLAAGLCLVAGLALTILGLAYPDTSGRGERAAAPWRAYRDALKRAARDATLPLDLDAALPDAVAFGAASALDRRLKVASKAGYAPAWFVRHPSMGTDAGFFPIWVAFHASAAPSSTSGGGAASGGGGAGGRF